MIILLRFNARDEHLGHNLKQINHCNVKFNLILKRPEYENDFGCSEIELTNNGFLLCDKGWNEKKFPLECLSSIEALIKVKA